MSCTPCPAEGWADPSVGWPSKWSRVPKVAAWLCAAAGTWEDFRRRVQAHLPRLEAMGIRYHEDAVLGTSSPVQQGGSSE